MEQSKVLVIYTGGTIGMVAAPDGSGLKPKKGAFAAQIEKDPGMNDEEMRKKLFGGDEKNYAKFFCLPASHPNAKKVVCYHIEEFKRLIDSSNMSICYWKQIASDIEDNYDKYDGFVVLHGTDTMAYTASALSFMLTNLKKTVIITGSQKPIYDTRSDAPQNFAFSVMLAGEYVVPEVSIFFNEQLIRGNRSIKRSSEEFFGFTSVNLPPLITVGVNVVVTPDVIWTCKGKSPFFAHLDMCDKVSFLRLYPAIPKESIQHAFDLPYEGVVMQTFGAGNIPTDRKDLVLAIKGAVDRGVIVLNITQCPQGPVEEIYATGSILGKLGVLEGSDMTAETALAKLMYVLSKTDWKLEDKKKLVVTSIRGELTVRPRDIPGNPCLTKKSGDCPSPEPDA